jgi:3-oxoacyl-[acyl-carrier-protein] synthase III
MNQIPPQPLIDHLRSRVGLVLANLGQPTSGEIVSPARFSDLLDSMGMVEFLALVAEDFAVTSEVIEGCVQGRFGSIEDLALALHQAGLTLRQEPSQATLAPPIPVTARTAPRPTDQTWLAATAACLPDQVQPASSINEALHRPAGWLENHAGILQRRLWSEQDPLAAAAAAGRSCLASAGSHVAEVGALLVTSEAPPLLTGLAAAVHHRLALDSSTPALEVGGACSGFLAAFWLAQTLLARVGLVLVVSVEAPSRYLQLQPGPAGDAAALFGDGAAACLLAANPLGASAIRIAEVVFGCDGTKRHLIDVAQGRSGAIELRLDGGPLASLAVRVMARSVLDLLAKHGLSLPEVQAVVAHGGNGRLPDLLARQLGLSRERVWSETPQTGNLGSASLPVGWSAHQPPPRGPVVWTTVGAGVTWAAALLGVPPPAA